MLKRTRNYVALLLAFLMCVSSVLPAFAANNPITKTDEDGYITSDPDAPVPAVITKNLRMPTGTNTPEAEFIFVARALNKDGRTDATTLAGMPGLRNLSVTYPNSGERVEESPDVWSIKTETENILGEVSFNTLGAGIYEYEITESAILSKVINIASEDHHLFHSDAKYILTVYVDNHPENEGQTYVFGVGARRVEGIDPETNKPIGPKVDMRPDGHGMIFANAFVKQNSPDNPEPDIIGEDPDEWGKDVTFTVSNTVTGPFANLNLPFVYTITMTGPDIHNDMKWPEYYRAYIVENGKVIDPEKNAVSGLIGGPDDNDNRYIKINPLGVTTFTLTNGQTLVFVDTPVGSKYNITQAAQTDYIPSYTITTNTRVGDKATEGAGEPIITGVQRIEEPTNSADFLNTRESVIPAGLSLANLPFTMMIVLGLGGLVAYIVVGMRKRRGY